MCPQNSFLSPQGSVYLGERADVLRVRLADYLGSFAKTKVFLQEKHAQEDTFFIADKSHSIATTEDYQVHPDLKKYADFFSDKTRYDAFFGTPFDAFLRQKRVHHVGLIGVETHTSVLFTAEELRNRGYEVSVVEPCTAARDEQLHGFAISLMRHWLGVRITNE